MILEIDGVDVVDYIANRGLKWQRSDVDGPDAGRDLTGYLERDRVATKIRLDITCKPLKASDASIVLSAIMPEWVTVRYLDPQAGTVLTKKMYSNNNPASYLIQGRDGVEMWDGITFPLIEK